MRQPTIDILYVAHKRREFTAASLSNLIDSVENTQHKIKCLSAYADGDAESYLALSQLCSGFVTASHYLNDEKLGGPVAVFNHFMINHKHDVQSDYILKLDNDTMLPPGWLDAAVDVLTNYNVDLLGIEAWAPDPSVFPQHAALKTQIGGNRMRMTRHVGGIGFFRRSAFYKGKSDVLPKCDMWDLPIPARDGRYGFTEWQWAHPHLVKGFIDPPLPVFLLDHIPREPWMTLNRQYEAEGVQRRVWGYYPEQFSQLWDWYDSRPDDRLRDALRENA